MTENAAEITEATEAEDQGTPQPRPYDDGVAQDDMESSS